jgi:hypothetical protein
MKQHFQPSILLSCAGTLAASLLISAPAAHAQCVGQNDNVRCHKQELDSDIKNRESNRNLIKNIEDIPRPNINKEDFGGGLGNIFFSLRPSLMYSTTGIGYGAQTTFRFSREGDARFALYLQPEITTWDISTTYKFGEPGEMQPFIGGGWQRKNFGANFTGNREQDLGAFLMAGVDLPLGNMAKVSAQVRHPIAAIVSLLPEMKPSPSSTELQVMFSLFDF